jgi:hypothetical protein
MKSFLKDKRAFLMRDFVVVGIIFGMLIALYIASVASVANNYTSIDPEVMDKMTSASFAQHYSRLSTNLNQLNTTTAAVQGSGGLNLVGLFSVAFNSVFTAVTMVWDGILIYTGMGSNIVGDFSFLDSGPTTILVTGAIAILTTYLIFIWLSSVSRGKL